MIPARFRSLSRFAVLASLLFAAGSHMAQAAAPVVSNVRASQRLGTGLVDIYYNLADADGDSVPISAAVSLDGGALYGYVGLSFSDTGYGPSVAPGIDRHIIWDAGADLDPLLFQKVKVRVSADNDGMALIPAGSFQMGDTFAEGGAEERPVHSVSVSAFYIDRIEVAYSHWKAVYDWARLHGYAFDNVGAGKAIDHPAHTVNWFDAVKWCNARSEREGLGWVYFTDASLTTPYRSGQTAPFAKWAAAGYRLPTEAEWEKAARGGTYGWRFPWGDTISHAEANYVGSTSYAYDVSVVHNYHPSYATGSQPYTSPSGAFAANPYGLHDMAGNLWEWCWDWYDGGWYAATGARTANTRGPTSGQYRVLRGGSWYDLASYSRCAARSSTAPAYALTFGFRCVRGAF